MTDVGKVRLLSSVVATIVAFINPGAAQEVESGSGASVPLYQSNDEFSPALGFFLGSIAAERRGFNFKYCDFEGGTTLELNQVDVASGPCSYLDNNQGPGPFNVGRTGALNGALLMRLVQDADTYEQVGYVLFNNNLPSDGEETLELSLFVSGSEDSFAGMDTFPSVVEISLPNDELTILPNLEGEVPDILVAEGLAIQTKIMAALDSDEASSSIMASQLAIIGANGWLQAVANADAEAFVVPTDEILAERYSEDVLAGFQVGASPTQEEAQRFVGQYLSGDTDDLFRSLRVASEDTSLPPSGGVTWSVPPGGLNSFPFTTGNDARLEVFTGVEAAACSEFLPCRKFEM